MESGPGPWCDAEEAEEYSSQRVEDTAFRVIDLAEIRAPGTLSEADVMEWVIEQFPSGPARRVDDGDRPPRRAGKISHYVQAVVM